MALIKCPECGREISDKAEMCIGCGYPLEKYSEEIKKFEDDMEPCPFCNYANKRGVDYCDECGTRLTKYQRQPKGALFTNIAEKNAKLLAESHTICPECGCANEVGKYTCVCCGHKYTFGEYNVISKPDERNMEQRCCPKCGGTRFHAFVEEQVIIPGKVKSQTTLNLNPFKPFTVFNHKEKVVRQAVTRQVSKFVCDDCGKIFE